MNDYGSEQILSMQVVQLAQLAQLAKSVQFYTSTRE